MINPGELHTLYSPNGCVYYCLHIGKQILETLGTTRPLNVQTVDPMVISAISDILVELSCGDAYYRQNAVAKATQLVVYLYRNHAANSSETLLPNREIAVVKQILAYLEQNYVQRVYIADLCAHLNFSASYLSHVFKKFTGHSIVEHVNTLRCGRACELLRSSTYNIAQIAFMCGFRSSAYFCAIFRRECGVSPATYRVTNQMNL